MLKTKILNFSYNPDQDYIDFYGEKEPSKIICLINEIKELRLSPQEQKELDLYISIYNSLEAVIINLEHNHVKLLKTIVENKEQEVKNKNYYNFATDSVFQAKLKEVDNLRLKTLEEIKNKAKKLEKELRIFLKSIKELQNIK